MATKRIFIIGGGPSLKLYDLDTFKKISKNDVIATNNAYRLFPEAMHLHFGDKVWWTWNAEHVRNNYTGPISTAAVGTNKAFWEPLGIEWYRRKADKGIAFETGQVCGNNAGHRSLNLAIKWGYEEIYLLGYDLKKDKDGDTHWHKLHKRETRTCVWNDTMLPGFNSIPGALSEAGLVDKVKIFNCSLDSALEAFPKIDVREIV